MDADVCITKKRVAAFVGLGTMGYPIAGRLASSGVFSAVRVYTRTSEKAHQHAHTHNSVACESICELLSTSETSGRPSFVFTCLPTTTQVGEVVDAARPHLARGTVWIDITTGDPTRTRAISLSLIDVGVHFVDAPVSGGSRGAAAGTLTTMVGADASVLDMCRFALSTYCACIVHAGCPGNGHTLKAVNNAMAVSHFVIACEGLVALSRAGVPPAAALKAINASSGRSLMTEARFPSEVLTRQFSYGGKGSLSLWAKDAALGAGVVSGSIGHVATLIPAAADVIMRAADAMGGDADETELVRLFETACGVELTNA